MRYSRLVEPTEEQLVEFVRNRIPDADPKVLEAALRQNRDEWARLWRLAQEGKEISFAGMEVRIPGRDEFFSNLEKVSKPK